jgi:hypothetical protein
MKGKTTQRSRIVILIGILAVCGILIAIGSGCIGYWGGFGGHKDCGWGGCGNGCGWNGCHNDCNDCKPEFYMHTNRYCNGNVFVNKGQSIDKPERPDCDSAPISPPNCSVPANTTPNVPQAPFLGIPANGAAGPAQNQYSYGPNLPTPPSLP